MVPATASTVCVWAPWSPFITKFIPMGDYCNSPACSAMDRIMLHCCRGLYSQLKTDWTQSDTYGQLWAVNYLENLNYGVPV